MTWACLCWVWALVTRWQVIQDILIFSDTTGSTQIGACYCPPRFLYVLGTLWIIPLGFWSENKQWWDSSCTLPISPVMITRYHSFGLTKQVCEWLKQWWKRRPRTGWKKRRVHVENVWKCGFHSNCVVRFWGGLDDWFQWISGSLHQRSQSRTTCGGLCLRYLSCKDLAGLVRQPILYGMSETVSMVYIVTSRFPLDSWEKRSMFSQGSLLKWRFESETGRFPQASGGIGATQPWANNIPRSKKWISLWKCWDHTCCPCFYKVVCFVHADIDSLISKRCLVEPVVDSLFWKNQDGWQVLVDGEYMNTVTSVGRW